MNTLERKKFNMLVHLAKADGKFEKSEKDLLKLFLSEKGLDESQLYKEEQPMNFNDFTDADAKVELLYWAIKLIQADQVIHEKEILFCKNLALKLKFKEEIIDQYAHSTLPDYARFEQEIKKFWLMGL